MTTYNPIHNITRTMRLKNNPLVIITVFALYLTSCKSIQTTTTKSEGHTETTYTVLHKADSVYVMDSIYVYVTQELVRETRWRTMWRDRLIHDTVHEHTTDTIYETNVVEKVKEVPAKGSATGWIVAAVLLALIAGYIAIKYFLK